MKLELESSQVLFQYTSAGPYQPASSARPAPNTSDGVWAQDEPFVCQSAFMAALIRFANHELFLTPTVAGELGAGESMRKHEVWSRCIEPFAINSQVCWQYGCGDRSEIGLILQV
jgi:hypothetical protein